MSKSKESILDGVKYTYGSDWIHKLESREHWMLYHYQQQLMEGNINAGDRVLEIGPGSGFCANYLKSKRINVTTLDIDEEKDADIHANLVNYEFEESYDHILAFEVFEHIPYEKFLEVLIKLRGKCSQIFMSVPENKRRLMELSLWLPVIKNISFSVYIPKTKITEPNHFWEVGYKNITNKRLKKDIEKAGFKIYEKSRYKGRIYALLRSV